MSSRHNIFIILKPIVFILCLLPLAMLLIALWQGNIGANPVETITHATGEWALRLLLITLAITPLRQLTGWNKLQLWRRMLGLYAFFYAFLHFLTYLVFDHFFDWHTILEDIIERPYITVGFSAFVLLIPLAITSTNGMMKRLKRNWQRLHRLVYLIALLAIVHFLWLVKADLLEPLLYALILLVLLAYRLWRQWQKTPKRSAMQTRPQ